MKKLIGGIRNKIARRFIKMAARLLAEEVYQGLYGRVPDQDSLAVATTAIKQRGDIAPLVNIIVESDEFRTRNTVSPMPEIVRGAFNGLLKRDPTPEGLKVWVDTLDAKKDFAGFFSSLVRSPEFKKNLYQVPPVTPKGRPAITRPAKRRLIIVSSNCQTAGIAAALQGCFPDDTVQPLPLPEKAKLQSDEEFISDVKAADVWVTSTWERLSDQILGPENGSGVRLVKLPVVKFPAFHPDLCYVWRAPLGQLMAMPYNSAIAGWAYNQKLTPADASKLFNRESFAALGYFNLWNPSMTVLREGFEKCDLDFGRYMLALKRRGVFMHSVDHPKVDALVELAKLIAFKMGAPESVLDKTIQLNDGLMNDIWPVYPEVADEFSLPQGSYDWKLWNEWISGREKYLEFAFETYAAEKVPAGGLRLHNRDETLYDRVLGPQVGIVR